MNDKAAALEVRGFRRGNNANNTNLSPLYVNGNNTPSNTNSNYAFGNYYANRKALGIQSNQINK